MKRQDKIKQVIRSKLETEQRKFSFVVEGKKHFTTTASNFANALGKALYKHRGKWVRYNLKLYLMAEQEGMDFVSAKVEAAARSKRSGKKVYIWVNEEGDHYFADHPIGGTVACFSNGSELKEERPTEPVVPAKKQKEKAPTQPAKQVLKKETATPVKVVTKQVETKTKEIMATATKKTAKKSTPAKKSAPVKKAAPAKKAASTEEKTPRGNNMFLTAAQWKKVDALLTKEDISFSAWSRGLVEKAIKG